MSKVHGIDSEDSVWVAGVEGSAGPFAGVDSGREELGLVFGG
jgi:hypothetical protein